GYPHDHARRSLVSKAANHEQIAAIGSARGETEQVSKQLPALQRSSAAEQEGDAGERRQIAEHGATRRQLAEDRPCSERNKYGSKVQKERGIDYRRAAQRPVQAEKVERKESAGGNEPAQPAPLPFCMDRKRCRLTTRERKDQECWRCERDAVKCSCSRRKLAQSHQNRRGAERNCTPQQRDQRKSEQPAIGS